MRNNAKLRYQLAQAQNPNNNNNTAAKPIIDFGPSPITFDISKATEGNEYYRRAIWTGENLQATLMSIKVGGEIGLEIHPSTDQFIRVEKGMGQVQMGKTKDNLTYVQPVFEDSAIFVPAGTWHNVVNTGNEELKVYTIYAPPHHTKGVIHVTKEQADREGD